MEGYFFFFHSTDAVTQFSHDDVADDNNDDKNDNNNNDGDGESWPGADRGPPNRNGTVRCGWAPSAHLNLIFSQINYKCG